MGEIKPSRCYIFGGYTEEFNQNILADILENDFVISADNGTKAAQTYNIKPNLVVGDFDSFSGELPKNCEVISLPREKDDTDLHFAVNKALERGYRDIVLSGVTGGRFDMSLATVSTMLYIHNKGANVRVCDKSTELYITSSMITLTKPSKPCHLSVFSLCQKVTGLTIKGAKYCVEDFCLSGDYPVGVSNEFVANKVDISLKSGTVLIVISK